MSIEPSRRDMLQAGVASLLTVSLLETLFQRDAFGDAVKPITLKWFRDMQAMCADVKRGSMEQEAWRAKISELFRAVDLPDLLRAVDFDKLTAGLKYKEQGERSLRFTFPEVEGLPKELAFGRQIFALARNRSVVPHGHNNMATAFLVMKGEFQGRSWDRLEDGKDFFIIQPTVDEKFTTGGVSTVSDYHDNVHHFKAMQDGSFIFNIHVHMPDIGRYKGKPTTRVYIDPEGEQLAGGRIKAPIMKAADAYKKYG